VTEGGEKVKIKFFATLLALLTIIMVVPVALAEKPSVQDDFVWWQSYDGWGPGEYYGQKVLVHYTAVNKWVLQKKAINGDFQVVQTLWQNGNVTIYEYSGSNVAGTTQPSSGIGAVIDTKLFRVVEVTRGISSADLTWYHISSIDVEVQLWNYHWIIPGVYHYYAYNHNGVSGYDIIQP
jgi:hypothetical protein